MTTIEDKEEEIGNIHEELKKLDELESTLDYE
jgi:hypothetical protein